MSRWCRGTKGVEYPSETCEGIMIGFDRVPDLAIFRSWSAEQAWASLKFLARGRVSRVTGAIVDEVVLKVVVADG
jgi:hypothetical protein